MKYFLLLSLTLFVPFISFSQTGPAGIGDNSTNGLWLRADKLSLNDGDAVSNWNDVSGNTNNAQQADAGDQPVFVESSSINGQPAVRFDGVDQMQVADVPILDGTEGITYYAVVRPTNLNGAPRGILGKRVTFSSNSNYAYTWFFWNGNQLFNDVDTSNNRYNTGSTTYSNNTNYILSWDFDGSQPQAERSNMREGSEVVVTGGETSTVLPDSNQPLTLGALNEDYGTYLAADYAEIIHFNYAFDDVDHILMQNYLSAKYDIALVNNDLYDEDDNGDYDYEVVGLGALPNGQINNDAQGCGVVRINNPAGLDEGEFFMFGHDNGELQATETTDVPATVDARFDRVWRASEVDTNGSPADIGAIDASFDLSDFNSVVAADLVLLVDTNNDGSFADETPISGAVDLGGGIYQFQGITAINDNMRFTLGTTDIINTPLPIKLTYFTANVTPQSTVMLEWQTASEVNNDFFTIERSENGIDWEIVDVISGAGNSSTELNYSLEDVDPLTGQSFYRLKQTDFDRSFTYSDVEQVYIDSMEQKLVAYPNPAIDLLQIKMKNQPEQIQLFNRIGQSVTSLVTINRIADGIVIDVSGLPSGSYYLKTEVGSVAFMKR